MPKGKTSWPKRVSNPGPLGPESYPLPLRHTGSVSLKWWLQPSNECQTRPCEPMQGLNQEFMTFLMVRAKVGVCKRAADRQQSRQNGWERLGVSSLPISSGTTGNPFIARKTGHNTSTTARLHDGSTETDEKLKTCFRNCTRGSHLGASRASCCGNLDQTH